MQAIIFISLSLIIILFVIYLGVSAVQKGLKSKQKLNEEKNQYLDDDNMIETNISEELNKLNDLFKSGAITEDEFKKAKEKILND
tara:strand:+ start:298 stop:552 length:255 start_codon:yes stop_codon:yes gene_type:complete